MSTGPTGPQGLQGLRGLQGPPRYAYRGPPYGSETARITVKSPTGSTVYLTPQSFGNYFNITSNTTTGNPAPLTISFPFYNPTYGLGPTGTISGALGNDKNIIYTTTSPVSNFGLRANSLISITGTLSGVVNVIPPGQVRVSSDPGPTGNTFSVDINTDDKTSSGTGYFQETTAVETTNEAYPTPEQAGSFWVVKNNYASNIAVTFSNGSAIYQGVNVTSMTLSNGYKMTVLYTGNGFIVI